MKESAIEKYLNDIVKIRGGFTRKVVYQGRKGSPDRWCFFNNRLLIIELKRPGEKPEPLQDVELRRLREAGMAVCWADCKDRVAKAVLDFERLTPERFNDEWPL